MVSIYCNAGCGIESNRMSDMNKFIGYVTTIGDVTQKSMDSVGESKSYALEAA